MAKLHQTENINRERGHKKEKGGNYRVEKYNPTLTGGAEQQREPAGERIREPGDFGRGGPRASASAGWRVH